jgi:hypothetical protein
MHPPTIVSIYPIRGRGGRRGQTQAWRGARAGGRFAPHGKQERAGGGPRCIWRKHQQGPREGVQGGAIGISATRVRKIRLGHLLGLSAPLRA